MQSQATEGQNEIDCYRFLIVEVLRRPTPESNKLKQDKNK